MNRDDLIKKLTNTKVPQVELSSHREKLKTELLRSDLFRERDRDISWISRGSEVIKSFVIAQPKWKSATVGILVLVLIIALGFMIPIFDGKSNVALAEEIARHSEAFKLVSAGEGEVTIKQVVDEDNKVTITYATSKGNEIVVEVDLKSEGVRRVELKFPGVEVSEAEKAEAIAIAVADSRVKEIMAEGFTVQIIIVMPLEGKPIDLVLLPQEFQETDYVQGKRVRVDIDKREVISINNFGMLVSPDVPWP